MGPEAKLEQKLRQTVEAAGGMCVKMTGSPGFPDRLILLPGGRALLIELKSDRGRTSKLQDLRIEKLRRLGFDARVVKGSAQTEAFCAEIGEVME